MFDILSMGGKACVQSSCFFFFAFWRCDDEVPAHCYLYLELPRSDFEKALILDQKGVCDDPQRLLVWV